VGTPPILDAASAEDEEKQRDDGEDDEDCDEHAITSLLRDADDGDDPSYPTNDQA
jgi:hypothetical protein